jgi:two-component system chemotaxis response regulator CheB
MRPGPRAVLVCANSSAEASLATRLLEHDAEIKVAGYSGTGADALRAVDDLRPDLVLMMIDTGDPAPLHGVELIMGAHPLPILVVAADDAGPSSRDAALAAGALDVMAKTELDLDNPASEAATRVRRRVVFLSHTAVIRHPRGGIAARTDGRKPGRGAAVIGICASAGGPQALRQLFAALPEDYALPILVVQHISRGSTESLAQWLDDATAVEVKVGAEGARADHGIWIAPDDAHLKLTRPGLLDLDTTTVRGTHRPSGDVLLESIASTAGRLGIGIVLTGMGSDGAMGVRALRGAGGFSVAQDEASSAIYGMPRAAAEAGADLVLALPEIASWLLGLRYQPLEAVA